jgi:hypothetical protein
MGALQRVERLGRPRVLMISGAICSDGGAVTVQLGRRAVVETTGSSPRLALAFGRRLQRRVRDPPGRILGDRRPGGVLAT